MWDTAKTLFKRKYIVFKNYILRKDNNTQTETEIKKKETKEDKKRKLINKLV